ncbi:hypothetical protein DE146DRAFT_308450 [Phaeosphaeria sp. MPI-PUGE-AT-0046c]|nr:hypothetical protein DE146DRAFT_308450 [Phaeosphaeria sp. MPI-PUGE-AT-0046c]
MDPASIIGLVAACSSLTKQCASVVKALHGLIETYKSAELIILAVATECETIQFAWCRIETWAQEQLHHVDDFEEVEARLQKSIYCGELVMSALEEELLNITSRSGSFGRGSGLTWNNSVLNEHQHRIRGQVTALQLLLQVLNLPRREDRIEVLSVKESVFSETDESALSIVPSDRSTLFSLDGNRLSIISDDGDVQYIRFSFEDALFTSHVYKRNYRFPTKRANTQDQDRPLTQMGDSPSTAPEDTETETKIFAVDEHDEGDKEFFEEEMAQFHHDLFAEEAVIHLGSEYDENERRERNSTSFLRRALYTANNAVLLDNAQNFTRAQEHYRDACQLLQQVINRSKGDEDRRKLEAIRMTYHDRIATLAEMIPRPNIKSVASADTTTDKEMAILRIGQAI